MAKGLTTLAVKNAKPKAARLETPDRGCAGLYLVVQPSGAKSWAVRYRYNGKPRKLTLGAVYTTDSGEAEPVTPTLGQPLTLAGARKLAMHALHQIEKGIDPAADKSRNVAAAVDRAAQRKQDTVEKLSELFMERYAKKQTRELSWKETQRIFKTIIKPEWKNRVVHDITRRDIIDLLDGIVDRGTPIMANRTLAVVRKWFGWLASRDIISASPCVGVAPPSTENQRDRVLSDTEIKLFWKACDTVGWPYGPLAKLLLLTGQRRDEVGGMKWSEIDLDAKLWVLPRARMKKDIQHEVPLSSAAMKILKSLPRMVSGKKLVFTTTGDAPVGGHSRAKERFDAVMADGKKVDIPPWRIHDLRRTAATGMARLKIALPTIEKILAHSGGTFAGVVGVYQLYSFADEKAEGLEVWGTAVERLVSGEIDKLDADKPSTASPARKRG